MNRRDPSTVDDALVALVRELCARAGRPGAGDAEIRAALAPLSPREEKTLRRSAPGDAPARPLGPFAWADLARGTSPEVAAARELGGYYALQAERDALAAMVGSGAAAGQPAPPPERKPRPAPAREEPEPEPVPAPRATAKVDKPRVERLLGLFTYYRDAPSVAKSLGVSLADLEEELDALKIRRKAYRLTKGTDFDLPVARATPGVASGPSVRRRTKGAAPAPVRATASDKDADAAGLKKLLAVVGPRRVALAERLGPKGQPLSDAALLARFRAAGLERELNLRERDFVRGLYMKYRGSARRIAAELRLTPETLRKLVRELGLVQEIDRLVDGFRRELRNRKWPKDRIAQVLDRREYLTDLGVYDELEREVIARTKVLWEELRDKPRALEELRRALDLTRPDLDRLRKLAQLG